MSCADRGSVRLVIHPCASDKVFTQSTPNTSRCGVQAHSILSRRHQQVPIFTAIRFDLAGNIHLPTQCLLLFSILAPWLDLYMHASVHFSCSCGGPFHYPRTPSRNFTQYFSSTTCHACATIKTERRARNNMRRSTAQRSTLAGSPLSATTTKHHHETPPQSTTKKHHQKTPPPPPKECMHSATAWRPWCCHFALCRPQGT